MTPLQNQRLLVILGYWNRLTFTQEWISNMLLPNRLIEFEASPIPNITAPGVNIPGFKTDLFRFFIGNDRLFIHPNELSESVFSAIEEFTLRLADILPHNPSTAFGINFVFEEKGNFLNESYEKSVFNKLLEAEMKPYLSEETFLIRENGYRVMVKIDRTETNRKLHFNYHYDLPGGRLTALKSYLNSGIISKHQAESSSILDVLYN